MLGRLETKDDYLKKIWYRKG